MWIHGRYFDIWRRRNLAPVILLSIAAIVSGCVVTEKIEFDEVVNHPFAVLSQDPHETYLTAERDSTETFSVTIWDPDFDEVADIPLTGLLVATSDVWSRPYYPSNCSPESLAPDEEGRISYEVACDVTLAGIGAGTLVEFTLVVSDKGFYSNKEPRDGANVMRTTWVVEVR